MPKLPISDLIKICHKLTIRSLSKDFRNKLTPNDLQSIRRIESDAVQYNSHLDINEVAVLLYGCSRLAPKNTPVAGPLCSRINSLYENTNTNNESDLTLEHISTIAWSLNRIIKYSEDIPLSIGNTSVLLSHLFTKFVKSCINTFEGELSQVFTPKEFSKFSVSFALLDKLLVTPELFSNESKAENHRIKLEMYDGVNKLVDGIFLSCLKDCEYAKFNIGANTLDSESWHIVYIKNGINILRILLENKCNIETVAESFERLFLQLDLTDVKNGKTLADASLIISKGKREYSKGVNAMLSELSKRDLTFIPNDTLLGIISLLSEHYIQHSEIIENICSEFSNRSYTMPSVNDTVLLVKNLSALSYRNESMLELCIRHINNDPGGLSREEFKLLVDSCVRLHLHT